VWLCVSSTAPSTDIFTKLFDVAPDGTTRMIVRGQGRLTDTSGGAVVRIEMGHTGYRVRPGYRLRLNLASSDYPEFLPHPGTAESPWLATETKPSTQTLITRPGLRASITMSVLG